MPAAPFVGAAEATHALALHVAVSFSVPAVHDRSPEIVYPLLQVGVHVLPLARLDVHVPAAPFVGAADALQGLAGVEVEFGASAGLRDGDGVGLQARTAYSRFCV
jgi:hypothetical protein